MAGIQALQNYLQNSKNREPMAVLYAQSLLSLLEPQARPVVTEEANAYIERGETKHPELAWWPLRSYLRSLGLFCYDAQMAEVMLSRYE